MPDSLVSAPATPSHPDLDVVVLHETNGRKYFEALVFLHRTGHIRSLEFYEPSVVWKFGHSLLRERKPVAAAFSQSLRNLRFRLTCWRMRDRIVIMGVAPWDIRLLLYARLRFANWFVYHTSWPDWSGAVPRSHGALTPWIRRAWIGTLRQHSVVVAGATGVSGESVSAATSGKRATVIPHVVSDAFFESRARSGLPFRLLFLGELSEKKGLPDVARVMDLLRGEPVVLDIVGDGPLHPLAAELGTRPGCKWHGHVKDRQTLARIVSNCQMLISPSVRTGKWEELFGISIIEAMASGVPCVASDHVGPRSIITNDVDGIILPEHSPERIADRIRQMINHPAEWQAMSVKAVATARQYSLQETALRWKQLLASVQTRSLKSTVTAAITGGPRSQDRPTNGAAHQSR